MTGELVLLPSENPVTGFKNEKKKRKHTQDPAEVKVYCGVFVLTFIKHVPSGSNSSIKSTPPRVIVA